MRPATKLATRTAIAGITLTTWLLPQAALAAKCDESGAAFGGCRRATTEAPRYVIGEPLAPQQREEPPQRWYGDQTLLSDGLAFLLIGAGLGLASGEAGLAGLGLWGLGSPVIHAAHGHVDKTLGSLMLRVAAEGMLLLVFIECSQGTCEDAGPAAALLLLPAVTALDAASIASEPVREHEIGAWMGPWRSPTGASGVSGGVRMSF